MNWFETLFDSNVNPRVDYVSCGQTLSMIYAHRINRHNSLPVGDTMWIKAQDNESNGYGLIYATVVRETTIFPAEYKRNFPSSIIIRKFHRSDKISVYCGFNFHPFLRRITSTIATGRATVLFRNSTRVYYVSNNDNVNIFDTEFFTNDMIRIAALTYHKNGDTKEVQKILLGEENELV